MRPVGVPGPVWDVTEGKVGRGWACAGGWRVGGPKTDGRNAIRICNTHGGSAAI